MSTLSVSAIQNTASPVSNIVLNSDGSSTVALYNAGIAPSPIQTGTLWYDISGAGLVIWDGLAWVGVGGGGGTYTATAPIAVTGTVISLNLGLGVAANGTNLAFKMPVASTPPAINTSATGGFDGSMYWDDTLGALFIRYINTTGTPTWVQATASGSGTPAATQAQAAAGVITTAYLSPATGVPKDAANMTGAAILPSGTNAQRTAIATPVAGMQRYNTSSGFFEGYTGATRGWLPLAYNLPSATLPDLNITANQDLPAAGSYENITIAAGVTATVRGASTLYARTSVTINGTITGAGNGVPGAGDQTLSGSSTGPDQGNGLGGRSSIYSFASGYAGSGGGAGAAAANAGAVGVGGAGGNGGAGLVIQCDGNITVAATASLNFSGTGGAIGNVLAGVAGGGGGSGGAGGLVLLQATGNLTLAAGATLNVSGGNGGNANISGTPLSVTFFPGGCGGGGGYIVLNSGGTLSDSSTKTLTGGTGGSSAGVGGVNALAAPGAGFGGAGGAGYTVTANAGSAGQTLTNAFI